MKANAPLHPTFRNFTKERRIKKENGDGVPVTAAAHTLSAPFVSRLPERALLLARQCRMDISCSNALQCGSGNGAVGEERPNEEKKKELGKNGALFTFSSLLSFLHNYSMLSCSPKTAEKEAICSSGFLF